MVPLKIQTKESASVHDLRNNVLQNLELCKDCPWLGNKYRVHDKEAIMVSYGTSFRDNPDELKELLKDKKDYTIFTVKHCLPLFKELGIEPDYCVILDPREVLGVSTLGHKRADLFKDSNAKYYMVASMTHPSTTQLLTSLNKNIIGWHSACEAMKDPEVMSKVSEWIVGGSCSAMRAVSIARVMGYRKITLLGYDAVTDAPKSHKEKERDTFYSVLEGLNIVLDDDVKETLFEKVVPAIELYGARKADSLLHKEENEKGRIIHLLEHVKDGPDPKQSKMKVLIGNEIFWGTPELIAMAQDFEALFKNNQDVFYDIQSGGLARAVFDNLNSAVPVNPQEAFLTA